MYLTADQDLPGVGCCALGLQESCWTPEAFAACTPLAQLSTLGLCGHMFSEVLAPCWTVFGLCAKANHQQFSDVQDLQNVTARRKAGSASFWKQQQQQQAAAAAASKPVHSTSAD